MRVAILRSMNAIQRSWGDDSSEVTRPGDVLALSGELGEPLDDVWPVDLFVEEGWEDDESPALSFYIVGGPPSVVRLQQPRRVITHAHGVVKRIEEDRVLLGTPGSACHEITLGYRLPASVDLRPLIGRRVRVMLQEEPPAGGRSGQTLTIRTAEDRVWLVARCGPIEGVEHCLAGVDVEVSLSMAGDGPLVVATPDLPYLVAPGREARMRIGASRYVVELVSRDDAGQAAYFIADDLLWH
jgi:hypothetical protein